MNDEHDLSGFGDIGDPFAAETSAPLPASPPRLSGTDASSPTRARVSATRWIAFGAALVFEVPHLVLAKHRRDVTAVGAGELAIGLGVPLAVAAIAFLAATRKGPRGLGLSAPAIALLALGAPAVFVIATLAGAPASASDPAFWQHAAACGATTALLTLGPLLLGLWAFRRAFATAATWRTAALGVAGGALAAAAMSIACPLTGAAHVLVGHGAMMLVAGLAGAWLAPAVSRS